MTSCFGDLTGTRIHNSNQRSRGNKKIYGLLVWCDPMTFNPLLKSAFTPGMRRYLKNNPRYVTELNDLPQRMVDYGLVSDPHPLVSFLAQNPTRTIRATSAASQSNLNGRALVDVVYDMLVSAGLEPVREAKFGIDPRGYAYKWDLTVCNAKAELWLEIKAQNKRGSAEVKLFYNHLAISNIGAQFFDN